MQKHLAALVVLTDAICLFAASEPQVGPPFTPYHPPQSVPDGGNTGFFMLAIGLGFAAFTTALRKSR